MFWTTGDSCPSTTLARYGGSQFNYILLLVKYINVAEIYTMIHIQIHIQVQKLIVAALTYSFNASCAVSN